MQLCHNFHAAINYLIIFIGWEKHNAEICPSNFAEEIIYHHGL